MGLVLSKAAALVAMLPIAARGQEPWWLNSDEAPPGTFGLWFGIGLCVVAVVLVSLGIHYHRQRRLRATAVLPEDPFAVEAMQAGAGLFSRLAQAWGGRDRGALSSLASPSLIAGWEPRLTSSAAAEMMVDGPVTFEYLGAANPAPGADRRAIVRVEGRLRPPSKQVAISGAQRNKLLAVAGVVLVAAFVGIAVAPATKIRSARPTTILVRDGVPLGGTRLLSYRKGAVIDLTVRSNVADELYFQGYNIYRDVAPGQAVHFRIRATIEGSYPIELEEHQQTLAQITVQP